MTQEEIIEVAAEVIEPSAELTVIYKPAVFEDNLAALDAYVDQQIKPYIGVKLDPNDYDTIKEGRKCMADLNKLKKPIEDERKRIKKTYETPLKQFEGRVKVITSKIDQAREDIKKQVDDADAQFKKQRRAMLEEEYQGCAGAIADVIAFNAILEDEWLTRSVGEVKATNALADKVQTALDGYNTLQSKELNHKDEVVKHYAETLDVIGALKVEDELNERDRKMAEFKAKQEAAEAVKAQRVAPAPKSEPEPAPEQPTQAAALICRWSLDMKFEGTSEFATQVVATLKGMGITGASIKFVEVVEND